MIYAWYPDIYSCHTDCRVIVYTCIIYIVPKYYNILRRIYSIHAAYIYTHIPIYFRSAPLQIHKLVRTGPLLSVTHLTQEKYILLYERRSREKNCKFIIINLAVNVRFSVLKKIHTAAPATGATNKHHSTTQILLFLYTYFSSFFFFITRKKNEKFFPFAVLSYFPFFTFLSLRMYIFFLMETSIVCKSNICHPKTLFRNKNLYI